MDNADITDITLEQRIFEAVHGNKEAHDFVLASPWTMALLTEISNSMCREFNVDADDVRDAIADKLRYKIHKVKNPNQNAWTNCLTGWCYAGARNHCKNGYRHNRVVSRYNDRITHEKTQGRRMSANGHANPLPLRTENSPEDILLEKEAALLRHRLGALLRKKVHEVVATLPPGDLKIAVCWAEGMNLREIAAATDRSLPTVQRRLTKKVQKVIIKKIGLDKILETDPQLRTGAYELIANSLRELIRRGNAFHA